MARGPGSAGRLIDGFLAMLAAERGAAVNTLDAYRRDLGDYCAFLSARGTEPLGVETDGVRAYLADLEERGFQPSSAARKLSSIRQFHKFLQLDGRRGDDPSLVLEGPRQGRRLPKTLTEGASAVSSWCLVTAISALGMKTSFREVFATGWRPLGLMVAETVWIAALVLGSILLLR